MCYHYTLTAPVSDIARDFGLTEVEDFDPIFHATGFSFREMPVITQDDPATLQFYNWGLMPHWVKEAAQGKVIRTQTLNARCETVFSKPAFRTNIKEKRCLVPATGFYEWMDVGKVKYPHLIRLRSRPLFAFAGLYAHHKDKESGMRTDSFSIITTDANPLMARIHNLKKRMPVILAPDQYRQWLQPGLDENAISAMLAPYPEEDMEAVTITRRITNRKMDSNVPEVQQPMEYPELAML